MSSFEDLKNIDFHRSFNDSFSAPLTFDTTLTTVEENQNGILYEPPNGIPDLIDSPKDLSAFITAMQNPGQFLAVDTERADGIRYTSQACLVQIRGTNTDSFLIDPLGCPEFVKYLPTDSNQIWVFHAASEDLPCLNRLNIFPKRIFDTQIAARLLGVTKISLGDVTSQFLGIKLAKNHSNENWSLRPLPKSWLAYAALDVEFLPQLAETLTEILTTRGRLDWLEAESEKILNQVSISPAQRTWRDLKGVKKLRAPHQREAARRLYEKREKIAQKRDWAVHRVMKNATLLELAQHLPRSHRQFQELGLTFNPRNNYQIPIWLEEIRRACSTRAENCPEGFSTNLRLAEQRNLSVWVKLAPERAKLFKAVREMVTETAQAVEVNDDLLCPSPLRREFAATFTPQTDWHLLPVMDRLSNWQKELLFPRFDQLSKDFVEAALEPVS